MKIFHEIPENKNLFKNPVVTIGTFDGVHLGHQKILSALLDISKKKSSDPVAITFSVHPKKVIDPGSDIKILTSTEEKIKAIYNFGVQNIIILNFTREMASMQALDFFNEILLKKIDVSEIVFGYDHAFGHNREGNIDFISTLSKSAGIGIIRVGEKDFGTSPVSSTWIRREIEAGNIALANSLLGREYEITGRVSRGAGRGKILGFPTANIIPDHPDKVIPGDGVYAVKVKIDDDTVKQGMLNIGKNPTFSGMERVLEAHIFNFNEDIYDNTITVRFHEKIRDEIKFKSPEDLVKQIEMDRIISIKILN